MSNRTYSRVPVAPDKPLVWLKGQVKTPPFSAQARVEAGVLLRRLQRGERLSLPHSRPMPSMGAGCHELRVQDANVAWRIVYFVNSEAVVILEIFAKTTRTTPMAIIRESARRLKAFRSIG